MKKFDLRGLEIHSSRMWQWKQVELAFDVMTKTGLNALIFHQNDLVEQLVLPAKYFSSDYMWKKNPVRYHTIMNNRHYINRVIREAKEKGIKFYAEVKEIWYDEGLLELVPELRNPDGSMCASNPFWWEFIEQKMRELVKAVPDIAGIIVSPGTRESKVSISNNMCKCDRCRDYSALEWYYKLLDAMYRPLAENGKTLTVRDFAYSAAQQSYIMKAATKCSDNIIISLKNTPHDYYPTFPNNPEIGHAGNHPQWIEFDTWGQFFGVGFFPASVVEDMQYRVKHCYENGATGVTFRTDWEGITDASSFNSFNKLNVFSGGMLSSNIETDLDEIYKKWVENGLLSPMQTGSCAQTPLVPSDKDAWKKLRDFMKASWSVIEKTIYIRGHVLHEDCMYPDTLNRAFDMMTKIHGMDDWKPGSSKLVEATEENIKIIFEEKDKALEEVKKLPSILQLDTLGLPEAFVQEIKTTLGLYEMYVEGFKLCTYSCYLAKKALNTKAGADIKAARESLKALSDYRQRVIDMLAGTYYTHHVHWLFDESRLKELIEDIEIHLAKI